MRSRGEVIGGTREGERREKEEGEAVCFVVSEWKQASLRPTPENIKNVNLLPTVLFKKKHTQLSIRKQQQHRKHGGEKEGRGERGKKSEEKTFFQPITLIKVWVFRLWGETDLLFVKEREEEGTAVADWQWVSRKRKRGERERRRKLSEVKGKKWQWFKSWIWLTFHAHITS